jgi:hypothetical protein
MKLYADLDLPHGARWQNRLRKPDTLDPKKPWAWKVLPGGRKHRFAFNITDAQLALKNIIPVQDNPPPYDTSTQVRVAGDVDDQGNREYTVTDLSPEEIAARQQAAIAQLLERAKAHQATFCDENAGWQLANWKGDFYAGVGYFTDPQFRSDLVPYVTLIESWLKSIWDHYQAEKANILAGQEPDLDFAALGTLPFTFSEVRQTIYTNNLGLLPPEPLIVFPEP